MTTEERLRASLAARAEQVGADDLRSLVPPVRPRRGRPVFYAMAAAAMAAVVILPVVIIKSQTAPPLVVQPTPSPQPTPDPSPDPTPEQELPGSGWRIAERSEADLDGDGIADPVRIRVDGQDEFDMGERLRVEADLSRRDATSVILIDNGISFDLAGTIDADADGDRELVVWRESVSPLLSVLDVRRGEFVELRQQQRDPLQTGPLESGAGPGRAFDTGWFLRDGTLYSYRSVDAFSLQADSFVAPNSYEARLWAWRSYPGSPRPRLDSFEQGGTCRRDDTGDVSCVLNETTARFFPQEGTIDEGQSFRGDPDIDGFADVSLVSTAGGADVVVQLAGGARRTFSLRGELPFRIFRRSPEVGQGAPVTVLVQSEGVDSSGLVLLALVEDRLVEVDVASDIPFGAGFFDEVAPYSSWVGPDGSLYTRVAEAPDRFQTVYRWRFGVSSFALVADPVGSYCFDQSTEPPTVTRCR